MARYRIAFFMLVSAVIGFSVHDFVSDTIVKYGNRIHFIPKNASQNNVLGQTSADTFMTTITYNGSDFHPKRASVQSGNYLVIQNSSKTALMWLVSDIPGLSTSRGYGEGEQLRSAIVKSGTYMLKDTLNPRAFATIVVIP